MDISSPKAHSLWAPFGSSLRIPSRILADSFLSPRSILHNPEDYPDPETFNPARYLTPDGKLDPSVRDPRTACFGFGRRVCPGRNLADASLYANVVTALATIDIVRAKDGNGKEIVPEVEQMSGLLSHPKPFEWAARPRSRRAEELLSSPVVAKSY